MSQKIRVCAGAVLAGVFSALTAALAQGSPPPGYFDIPGGFDFPGDKAALEKLALSGDLAAQRKHAWSVFAGMTQLTPDGKYPVFETWFSEAETFQSPAALIDKAPRRGGALSFSVPAQMRSFRGRPLTDAAAGSAILSEVMFNFANYDHIRHEKLYLTATLDELAKTGAPDPKMPGSKTVPPFPANAVSLKTIWWPIFPDKVTPMPIWDPDSNPQIKAGNPYQTWKRVVAVDPQRQNIPNSEETTVTFLGQPRPHAHVVSLKDAFHYVIVDAAIAATANTNGRLQGFVKAVLGRPLQVGDIVAFMGTHLTTKEIDNWVWATYWWHDRPNDGPYAAGRPASLQGVWRNYLMSTSYDVNLPHEPDGSPHIAFNPWLEAHFIDGVLSNCMNCHNRASTTAPDFRPIMRGDPDLKSDPAFKAGAFRTDFLWSVLINAH